jgi:hypothetical protein
MQIKAVLLSLAAAASAADLRNYFEGNCGGAYAECTNVASGVTLPTPHLQKPPTNNKPQTCCVIWRDNGLRGAPSVGVVWASPGTQIFGYQRTRDGNNCGSIAAQKATGQYVFGCTAPPHFPIK